MLPAQDAGTPAGSGGSSWIAGIDSLRLRALGGLVGVAQPKDVERASTYTLVADYGEIVPGWRVQYSATFWNSRFTDAAVRRFARELDATIDDPTGDARVQLGQIDVSDIVVGVDLQRVVAPTSWFTVWAGGGAATHVINADGRLIDDTFVERAVDNLVVGLAGAGGAEIILFRHLAIEAQARYDLLSLARFGSLRVGAHYVFDGDSRTRAP